MHRIAWLIQVENVSPHGILAVTFTNKAAGEMRGRIEQLLGMPGGALWIGTFHGIAHRLLRLHWREASLLQSFQILDSEDQQRLISKMLKALELDEARWVPREMQWFINTHKDEGRRPQASEGRRRSHPRASSSSSTRSTRQPVRARRRGRFRGAAAARLRAVARQPELLRTIGSASGTCWSTSSRTRTRFSTQWMKLLAGATGLPFVVGDDDQCLAAGTPITMADGSRKPIEAILPGEQVLSSYGSGDFRPAKVDGAIRHGSADGRMISSAPALGKNHQEHARAHALRWLSARRDAADLFPVPDAQGRRRLSPGNVAGLHDRARSRPTVGFKQRALQEHADAAWIIRTHANENEARLDEMLTSLRYGLPTLAFRAAQGQGIKRSRPRSPIHRRVFSSLDTD